MSVIKMPFNLLSMVLYQTLPKGLRKLVRATWLHFWHYTLSISELLGILPGFCPRLLSGNRLKRTLTPSYGLTSKGMFCYQVASIFGSRFRIRSQTAILYVCHQVTLIINYTEKRIIWLDASMHAPLFLDLARPLLGGYFPKKILSHNTREAIP